MSHKRRKSDQWMEFDIETSSEKMRGLEAGAERVGAGGE